MTTSTREKLQSIIGCRSLGSFDIAKNDFGFRIDSTCSTKVFNSSNNKMSTLFAVFGVLFSGERLLTVYRMWSARKFTILLLVEA